MPTVVFKVTTGELKITTGILNETPNCASPQAENDLAEAAPEACGLVDVPYAAAYLKVSVQTLYKLLRGRFDGPKLKHLRQGQTYLFREECLEQFIEEHSAYNMATGYRKSGRKEEAPLPPCEHEAPVQPAPVDRPELDYRAAAAYLKMSRAALGVIVNGHKEGPRPRHVRIGRHVFFFREWLDEYRRAKAAYDAERRAERQRQREQDIAAAREEWLHRVCPDTPYPSYRQRRKQ